MKDKSLLALFLVAICSIGHAQSIQWESMGPNGGAFSGLIVNRSTGHVLIVWDGGVLRSEDAGKSWRNVNVGIYRSKQLGDQLGFGPKAWTIHRATGTILLSIVGGIYRSTDEGNTWNVDPASDRLPSITLVSPGIDSILFSGDKEGIFRSTDLGRTWASSLPASPDRRFIIVADIEQKVLYLSRGTAIYSSDDLGKTWKMTIDGIAGTMQPFIAIGRAGTLFASGMTDGLRRSTDRGVTWEKAGADLINTRVIALATDFDGRILAVDSAGHIIASTDGGSSFAFRGMAPGAVSGLSFGDSNEVFALTRRDGIFRSADNGLSWLPVNEGLSALQILSVAPVPNNRVVVGTNIGLYIGDSEGGWSNPTGLPASRAATPVESIVATQSNTLLAATTGVLRNVDNSLSWDTTTIVDMTYGRDIVWELIQTPWQTIYAGTYNGLIRSTDDGRTWNSGGLGGLPIKALAARSDRAMIAASRYSGDFGVQRSLDGGESWDVATVGIASFGVNDISFTRDGSALAAANGGLFRTGDIGRTWVRVDTLGSRVNFIGVAVVPNGPIVTATATGLYFSNDDGLTWTQREIEGGATIQSLAVDTVGRVLLGTFGRGVLRSRNTLASTNDATVTGASSSSLRVAPNPTRSLAAIRYTLDVRANVRFSVVNASGASIAFEDLGTLAPGEHTLNWNTSQLSTGIFFLDLFDGIIHHRSTLSITR